MDQSQLNGKGAAPAPARRRTLHRAAMIALVLIVASVAVYTVWRQLDSAIESYDTQLVPESLPADGVSSAVLEVLLTSRFGNRLNHTVLPTAPRLEIVEGADLVTVVPLPDSLSWRIVAGFQRGTVVIHVRVPGLPAPIEETLLLTPSLADRNDNGYPDVLDLTSASDRDAFRRWFVAIALGQLRHVDGAWQDRDCAGLLRYCYREALKRHDNRWLASRRWLVSAALPDVRKYNYPFVPLVGTRVFNAGIRTDDRSQPGTAEDAAGDAQPVVQAASRRSSKDDIDLGAFQEFAEAGRLKDNSLAFISRDANDAVAGDVIFYLNDTRSAWPYHTMIYIGNGGTVYHTGPDGDNPGIVKKMTLRDLAAHPDARWHPVPGNPYFLGFYRWRVLL